jgi:hypothetical protein
MLIERMSGRTRAPPRAVPPRFPALILGPAHRFKVGRVYARGAPTQVIQLHARGHRPALGRIHGARGVLGTVPGVAMPIHAPRPQMATIRVDPNRPRARPLHARHRSGCPPGALACPTSGRAGSTPPPGPPEVPGRVRSAQSVPAYRPSASGMSNQ